MSLPGIGMTIDLERGEEIRTEISCKFTRPRLERIFAAAGLEMTGWFTDPDGDFALSLAASRLVMILSCRRGVSAGRCM